MVANYWYIDSDVAVFFGFSCLQEAASHMNVPEIDAGSKEHLELSNLDKVRQSFQSYGYTFGSVVLNARDCGSPPSRVSGFSLNSQIESYIHRILDAFRAMGPATIDMSTFLTGEHMLQLQCACTHRSDLQSFFPHIEDFGSRDIRKLAGNAFSVGCFTVVFVALMAAIPHEDLKQMTEA